MHDGDAVVSKLIAASRGSPCDSMASCSVCTARCTAQCTIVQSAVLRICDCIACRLSVCTSIYDVGGSGASGVTTDPADPAMPWGRGRGPMGAQNCGSSFYRAMHFSAKRGIAIVYCPSVCPSVCDVQVS